MNLVAKEYVASQDPEDPGVLILSRFAGAAVECEAALLVNPYDPESVGTAIGQALSMPLDERRSRQDALFQVLMANDVKVWGERFIMALTRPLTEGADHQSRRISAGELSIDPVADEWLGRVTGRAGAS
jgi:trehalose 6-phosphate synthase